jgi:hypothetical protein
MSNIKIIIGIILLFSSAGALMKGLPKEKSKLRIIGFLRGIALLFTLAIYLIRNGM